MHLQQLPPKVLHDQWNVHNYWTLLNCNETNWLHPLILKLVFPWLRFLTLCIKGLKSQSWSWSFLRVFSIFEWLRGKGIKLRWRFPCLWCTWVLFKPSRRCILSCRTSRSSQRVAVKIKIRICCWVMRRIKWMRLRWKPSRIRTVLGFWLAIRHLWWSSRFQR